MILVTGGTGFVGRNIVRLLVVKGQKVRCLVRESSPRNVLDGLDVEFCTGDILVPGTLKEALQDIDTVIHLVGIIKEIKGSTFERIHSEGTKNILEAARNAEVKKYIHMSALGTRPGGISRYHKTKWLAEEAVRNSGLKYVILRPPIICGADDEFVNMFAKMIKLALIVAISVIAAAGLNLGITRTANAQAHIFWVEIGYFVAAFLISRLVRMISDKRLAMVRSIYLEYFFSLTYFIFSFFKTKIEKAFISIFYFQFFQKLLLGCEDFYHLLVILR